MKLHLLELDHDSDRKCDQSTLRRLQSAHAHTALPFEILDVFTTQRYTGNPLAVVHVDRSIHLDDQLLQIAQQFHLSETVFILSSKINREEGEASVRIFTPQEELPFAGHPTVGTTIALAHRSPSLRTLKISCPAGVIEAIIHRNSGNIEAELVIPHKITIHEPLTTSLTDCFDGDIPQQILDDAHVSPVDGMSFRLVELASLADLGRVLSPARTQVPGVFEAYYFYVKMASSAKKLEVRARLAVAASFEDPATGSAAVTLAGYLALRDEHDLDLHVTQGVEMGRRSEISVKVSTHEGKIDRILLKGSAIRTMRGTLDVDL